MFKGKLPNVTQLYPSPEAEGDENHPRLPARTRNDAGASPRPDAEKEARRAERRRRELSEPVEPWERYRALRQTLDEAQKFEDLADHKARFAMILMGALNAGFVVLALSDATGGLSSSRPLLGGYLGLCGVGALYLFHQAIEALRPRAQGRRLAGDPAAREAPIGLRHHHDVLRRSHEGYLAAWQQVGVGQLNSEIALQVHRQAEVNRAKEAALTRLYAGLRVMMFLLVGLVILLLAGDGGDSPRTDVSGKANTAAEELRSARPSRLPGRGLVGS